MGIENLLTLEHLINIPEHVLVERIKAFLFTEPEVAIVLKTALLALNFGPPAADRASKRRWMCPKVMSLGLFSKAQSHFFIFLKRSQLMIHHRATKLLWLFKLHVVECPIIKLKCK
jgi:hypothetical protein